MIRLFAFKHFVLAALLVGLSVSAEAKNARGLVAVSPVDQASHDDSSEFFTPDEGVPVTNDPSAVKEVVKPVAIIASTPEPPGPLIAENDNETAAAVSVPGHCKKCDDALRAGRSTKIKIAKAERASKSLPARSLPAKHIKVAKAKPLRILKYARQEAHPASTYANRVSQAAWEAANRCRDFAMFRKKRKDRFHLSPHKKYNSCKYFGKNNAYNSKGVCSTAVQEALREAGIFLPHGNSGKQKRNLARAGLVKVPYQPYKVPVGTVLVCGGGHGHNFGDIQIVSTAADGTRRFCSDFCSLKPVCSDRWHRSPQAFKFPGS